MYIYISIYIYLYLCLYVCVIYLIYLSLSLSLSFFYSFFCFVLFLFLKLIIIFYIIVFLFFMSWKSCFLICFPGLNFFFFFFFQSFIKIEYLYPPLKRLSFAADVIKACRSPSPSSPLAPLLLIQAPADREIKSFFEYLISISGCRNK